MEQVMMYYEKGVKAIELQAKVFWSILGQAMSSEEKDEVPLEMVNRPDRQKFREIYGAAIKRG